MKLVSWCRRSRCCLVILMIFIELTALRAAKCHKICHVENVEITSRGGMPTFCLSAKLLYGSSFNNT